MVKVLTIGDPHFKVSNVIETDVMVKAIIEQVQQLQPDFVVVLGDILDRHESIHSSPLCRSVEFLRQLKELCLTYVLIGNHDLINNRQFLSSQHGFTALKEWNNLFVVDYPLKHQIGPYYFVFVPYVPPGKFFKALDKLDNWTEAKCVFSHQEYFGATMGSTASTTGDVWELTLSHNISGHLHGYNELQPNLHYVGTPIPHNWGDGNNSISLYNFEDIITWKRIFLNLPKKRIVHLEASEVHDYKPNFDDMLKIKISGTAAELKVVKKSLAVKEWLKNGIKIAYVQKKTETIVLSELGPPPKFRTILENRIAGDVKLQKLYNEFFNR